jgi:DNA-binding transcriptional ArsR family regulator
LGQLIVGKPAPKQFFAVSAPLELTSAISLAFRAGSVADADFDVVDATPGFDAWLIECWRSLDSGLRHDLELLLGFSGRMLYYIEELLFAFDALSPDRLDATYSDYIDFLSGLPADRYQEMAARSVERVYHDRGLNETPPATDDPSEWRMFLRPAITRAAIDEAAALITSPDQLKRRTLALLSGFWEQCYGAEHERNLSELQRAVRFAQAMSHPSVQVTFSELTGHRLPETIEATLNDVQVVLYSPSLHLGEFVQYILYPPRLILYFNPRTVLRHQPSLQRTARTEQQLDTDEVLDGLRAMSDPSRMRIIEMLREREHYAQEVVARLSISQSAVSRHLSTLEDANIVTVRPANGMKYYAIDRARLRLIAQYLDGLAEVQAQ